MRPIDLDSLIDRVAQEIRRWNAAMVGLGRGADPAAAPPFDVAGFEIAAEVRLEDPACLAGPDGRVIRLLTLTPPAATGARSDAPRLHIQLDSAANGHVDLGPWRARIAAGQRIGAWEPHDAGEAAPSPPVPQPNDEDLPP